MGQNPPMNRLIRPASSATRGRASAQEGRRRASGRRRAFGNSFRPPLLRPYRDNRVIYRERATSLAVLCACAVTLLFFFFLVWFLVRDGVGEIDFAVPTIFFIVQSRCSCLCRSTVGSLYINKSVQQVQTSQNPNTPSHKCGRTHKRT